MNELSYSIENVELSDGYENFIAECFFYLVDGKKLEYQDYNPLSYWEVIEDGLQDDHFDNKEMVLINCCTCGEWQCDCVVAVVTEKPSSVMCKFTSDGMMKFLQLMNLKRKTIISLWNR